MFIFIATSFFALIIFQILTYYSLISFQFTKKPSARAFNGIIIMSCLFFGLFLFLISIYIKKVIINSLEKSITFQNIITRRKQEYLFGDFDGLIDTYLKHRYSNYKTIGLIKDNKMVRYIDSFWCSNYDELRDELNDLKYLGTFNFGRLKQLKLLLRRQIID